MVPKAATRQRPDAEAFGHRRSATRELLAAADSTPEVIDDIHIKAELGRYRMRGMASSRRSRTGTIDLLTRHADRFVIEGYRAKCDHARQCSAARQAAARPRYPGLRHRHELRRALLRSQDRAGARGDDGGLGDVLGRGRHDPRRAALLGEVVLPVHPEPLRLQPAPPASGRRGRVLHRPGLQGRPRRPSHGPEGDRSGGRDALAPGRHRPALAGPPSRLARTR